MRKVAAATTKLTITDPTRVHISLGGMPAVDRLGIPILVGPARGSRYVILSGGGRPEIAEARIRQSPCEGGEPPWTPHRRPAPAPKLFNASIAGPLSGHM